MFFKFKLNQFKVFAVGCVLLAIPVVLIADNQIIPAGNSPFYYKIGGGRDISLPPVLDQQTVELDASANLGLGYNCGVFNPMVSIRNSLNQLKGSFEDIKQQVIDNATAAIGEFPMYELSRADPNLYNILNNNLLGAHEELSVSTKSCQVMQSEIANGENPYAHWGNISMGNEWKKQMNVAIGTGSADINQAKRQVEQDNGDAGVPWVGGINAGGKGQPPVHVISDTVKAGYNVLLNRNVTDTSAPTLTDNNHTLVSAWHSPQAAADWVTRAVGDQIISTCHTTACKKGNKPGVGLLPGLEPLIQEKIKTLTQLVEGSAALNKENLEAISAQGVAISPQIIKTIQVMPPTLKAITVNKLGQEIATQNIINQALLARHVLQSGAQVPAIAANKEAQKDIMRMLSKLDRDIRNLLFEHQVKQQMILNMLSLLSNYDLSHEAASMGHQAFDMGKFLDQGALSK